MGQGKALTVALAGIHGHLVEVEALITPGKPSFHLDGLPRPATLPTRDRVHAAIRNSGHHLPTQRLMVNLLPQDLPKPGTSADLAIAVALLDAAELIPTTDWRRFAYVAELGLDGTVRPVRGIYAAALAAVNSGQQDLVVATQNVAEAQLVSGLTIHGVRTLTDVFHLHASPPPANLLPPGPAAPDEPLGPTTPAFPPAPFRTAPDLADVPARHPGRHILEVAAAGGHHLLLMGPPGTGKTLLATRLPGLLPDLSDPQAIEVTAIHSIAGTLDPAAGLIRRPPFENPYHTVTPVSMVGTSTTLPHPGSATRAHRGVLFLNEVTEFHHSVLDCLRQPLEQGELIIHRARSATVFPAKFQLVLASNPCPCDPPHHRGQNHTCAPSARRRYLARLSGPLFDRIDLQVELLAVSQADLTCHKQPENTATVAARVAQARAAQRERLTGTEWTCNAELPGAWLRGPLQLPPTITQDADRALDRAHLSIRGYQRVLRISWTLADLAGRTRPDRIDVAQALSLRTRASLT